MISPAPTAAASSTVPVPLAALAVDGTPPAEGDEVSFTVSGRIVSTDGQMAQVEVATINDQPVAMSDEATDRAMMDEAAQADSSSEGY